MCSVSAFHFCLICEIWVKVHALQPAWSEERVVREEGGLSTFVQNFQAEVGVICTVCTPRKAFAILHNILTISDGILTILYGILTILHGILTIFHGIYTYLPRILFNLLCPPPRFKLSRFAVGVIPLAWMFLLKCLAVASESVYVKEEISYQ